MKGVQILLLCCVVGLVHSLPAVERSKLQELKELLEAELQSRSSNDEKVGEPLQISDSGVHDVETKSNSFQSACLSSHNAKRSMHQSPSLSWDSALAAGAQAWANHLVSLGHLQHASGSFGENLYWSSSSSKTCTDAVNSWYSEVSNYNYNKPGFSSGTGHFTQVVWKSSTKLGCGSAVSSSNSLYVVCRYTPPGNYHGQYPANVLQPSSGKK